MGPNDGFSGWVDAGGSGHSSMVTDWVTFCSGTLVTTNGRLVPSGGDRNQGSRAHRARRRTKATWGDQMESGDPALVGHPAGGENLVAEPKPPLARPADRRGTTSRSVPRVLLDQSDSGFLSNVRVSHPLARRASAVPKPGQTRGSSTLWLRPAEITVWGPRLSPTGAFLTRRGHRLPCARASRHTQTPSIGSLLVGSLQLCLRPPPHPSLPKHSGHRLLNFNEQNSGRTFTSLLTKLSA